jgi:hypothetical protein
MGVETALGRHRPLGKSWWGIELQAIGVPKLVLALIVALRWCACIFLPSSLYTLGYIPKQHVDSDGLRPSFCREGMLISPYS